MANIGDFTGDTQGQIEVITGELNNPLYAADKPALLRELARLGVPQQSNAAQLVGPVDSPEAQALIAQSSGGGALSRVAPTAATAAQPGALSRVPVQRQEPDIAAMLEKYMPQDDSQSKYLALAAGFGSATKTGSFSEQLGNVASAMNEQKMNQQKLREQYVPLIMQQVAAQQAREEQNAYRLEAQQQAQAAQAAAQQREQQFKAEQNLQAQQEARTRAEAERASREQMAADRLTALQEGRRVANKPPAGYAWGAPGADGAPSLVAVKGGPADLKQVGMLNQDTQALSGATSSFDRLAEAANSVLTHPGLPGITGLRGAIPNVPGTDAANAQALLGTLKSQVGFGVLQDMRNQSKTGGALGAVSEKELAMLQSNLAALDKAQSLEQFQAGLKHIVDYAEKAKDRMREAYNLKHGSGGSTPITTPAGGAADPLGLFKGK